LIFAGLHFRELAQNYSLRLTIRLEISLLHCQIHAVRRRRLACPSWAFPP
jgi:hypothetical protein